MNYLFAVRQMAGRHEGPPDRFAVSDRMARPTTYALYNLQERGVLFVKPQVKVYEGMIVGENARAVDLDVKLPIKEKAARICVRPVPTRPLLARPTREMSLTRPRIHRRRRTDRSHAKVVALAQEDPASEPPPEKERCARRSRRIGLSRRFTRINTDHFLVFTF